MKTTLFLAVAATALVSCAQDVPYKVTVPMPAETNGSIAYLVNYDSGEKVDSVEIKDQKASFTGDVDEPFLAYVSNDGKSYGMLIVEQGGIAVNPESRMGVGSMLNDQFSEIYGTLTDYSRRLNNAQSEAEADSIYNEAVAYEKQAAVENIDNPIGYYLFLDYWDSAEPQEIRAMLAEYPSLGEYQRVKKAEESLSKLELTSVGRKFVDFESTYDGKTERLSDYVGKGKYVLADFWASWCGPCRREMPTLKDIYNEYKDKNLEVLGIAVWDKPEDTLAAIKQLELPWQCMINTQRAATDAYGINGIPCVILFGPDGTILSRGLRGEQLKAFVAETLR